MQAGNIAANRVELYRATVSNTKHNSSIEQLPSEIDALIDNKSYRNKFKKMIREGHLQDLLELAEVAAGKSRPSRWFAVVTSKARWQGTLTWLQKAREVARNAAEVARRLCVRPEQMKAVYKACWRYKLAVMPKATLAEELSREKGGVPLRWFNYLCWRR